MVHVASDVTAFLHRREVSAYEQRVARSAFAYGVDLRRSAWLDGSTLGDPIMRGVDRNWNAMVADLTGSILHDTSRSPPLALMEEIARIARLLRAPMPTLRTLVRGVAPGRWPIVTPLGTTKGAVHWLVVDADLLTAMPAHERAFLLGSALADLQCDHGPIFTAHLMSDRAERGLGLVRLLLRPWAKVGVFSADRGGLIATGALGPALSALRVHAETAAPWMPARAALALREQALADFDRSSTMARLRVLLARQQSTPPAVVPDEAPAAQGPDSDEGPDTDEGAAPQGAPAAKSGDPYRNAAPTPPKAAPPERDEEMERALADAWSLARCDARLTRRLGLL